jgi:hypothetical protein
MCCIINFFKKRKESIEERTKSNTVTIHDRSSTQTENEQRYNCRRFIV